MGKTKYKSNVADGSPLLIGHSISEGEEAQAPRCTKSSPDTVKSEPSGWDSAAPSTSSVFFARRQEGEVCYTPPASEDVLGSGTYTKKRSLEFASLKNAWNTEPGNGDRHREDVERSLQDALRPASGSASPPCLLPSSAAAAASALSLSASECVLLPTAASALCTDSIHSPNLKPSKQRAIATEDAPLEPLPSHSASAAAAAPLSSSPVPPPLPQQQIQLLPSTDEINRYEPLITVVAVSEDDEDLSEADIDNEPPAFTQSPHFLKAMATGRRVLEWMFADMMNHAPHIRVVTVFLWCCGAFALGAIPTIYISQKLDIALYVGLVVEAIAAGGIIAGAFIFQQCMTLRNLDNPPA